MLYERDDIVNCHTEYFLNFKFNWIKFLHTYRNIAVADPGFPVRGGGADLRRIHFLVKTYAKTKEMDPVGGGECAGGAPWIRQCIGYLTQKCVHLVFLCTYSAVC